MKLKMKLEDVDYGDAAVKLLPTLVEKTAHRGAMAQMVQAVAELPEEMIRTIIDEIPRKKKNQITAALFRENRERMLSILGNYLTAHRTGLTITDLELDEELNLTVELGEIDVVMLAEKFLPKLKNMEGGSGALLGMLSHVPREMWAGLLRYIPREEMLDTGVCLLNRSGDSICASATELLTENGISARVTGLRAEN